MKYTIEMSQPEFDRYMRLVNMFKCLNDEVLKEIEGLEFEILGSSLYNYDVSVYFEHKPLGKVQVITKEEE